MTLPGDTVPEELLCPACAYDLRGSASERCPECGLIVDRESLRTSGIPWAHRGRIGRFRAYFKTLWQVTWGYAALRHEHAREQNLRDARSFSRITAALLAMSFLSLFAAIIVQDQGYSAFAVARVQPYSMSPSDSPAWIYDIAVPWSAGAVMAPVLPLCLITLAFFLVAVLRPVFRVPASPAARGRAEALGLYVSAPLAWLPLGVGCMMVAEWIGELFRERLHLTAVAWNASLIAIIIGFGIAVLSIGMTFFRAGQWAARARHGGLARGVLAAGEIAGLWLLAGAVFLGLFPWCVGFVWVVFDSLQNQAPSP